MEDEIKQLTHGKVRNKAFRYQMLEWVPDYRAICQHVFDKYGVWAAEVVFDEFDNPRKFACYCGVAPFEHTSGTSIRGKTRTSKLAAKDLKVFLTRAAITAMVHDSQIRTYYLRKVSEGKHKASVINTIRAKIIYRCFAVVKRQTPFVRLIA